MNPDIYNCPFCGKPFKEQEEMENHSDYCDLNPSIQKRMMNMLGLTFEKCDCLVRITEVVPGDLYPLFATVLTMDNMGGNPCASVMQTRLSYRSVMGRDYDKDAEYEELGRKIINDIERTLRGNKS